MKGLFGLAMYLNGASLFGSIVVNRLNILVKINSIKALQICWRVVHLCSVWINILSLVIVEWLDSLLQRQLGQYWLLVKLDLIGRNFSELVVGR